MVPEISRNSLWICKSDTIHSENENSRCTTIQPLSTKDIFLFNELRATSDELCNYSILESIKDGTAVSSKYNNDVIRFKIPNVIVVFSNHMPNTRDLSKD